MATQLNRNLIPLIISNFNTKELSEEVIISDLKNSVLRRQAIKFYRKFSTEGDYYTHKPDYGKGEFGFSKFIYKSELGVNPGTKQLLSTHNCHATCIISLDSFCKFKGTLSIDDKIIDGRTNPKSGSQIIGNILDTKTGETFYSAKINTCLKENKITGIYDGYGTLNYNGVKFIVPKKEESPNSYLIDSQGQEIPCKMSNKMFPSKYEGKIAINNCMYNGVLHDFEIENYKGFTGTVTNLSYPEIVFIGDCDLNGEPQIGEGQFIYQKVVYDGKWDKSDAKEDPSAIKFVGEAYSVENPNFKFSGTFFDFLPSTGKGEFIWDGVLYKGTVENFRINAFCYSGKDCVLEIKENEDSLLVQGEIQFGHFSYSFVQIEHFSKLTNKNQSICGKIYNKKRLIYEGYFYHHLICGEGLLAFDSKIYNKGVIYSILENEI